MNNMVLYISLLYMKVTRFKSSAVGSSKVTEYGIANTTEAIMSELLTRGPLHPNLNRNPKPNPNPNWRPVSLPHQQPLPRQLHRRCPQLHLHRPQPWHLSSRLGDGPCNKPKLLDHTKQLGYLLWGKWMGQDPERGREGHMEP